MNLVLYLIMMANFSADNSVTVFSSQSEESTQVNMKFARDFKANQYDAIYVIIKESFANFPAKSDQKISFNISEDQNKLSIVLKTNKVKIKYSSKKKKSPLGKTTSNLIKALEKL